MKRRKFEMMTLGDIDSMFPLTRDGSVYSDLYKQLYRVRPQVQFASIQDFDDDYTYIIKKLGEAKPYLGDV